MTKSVNLTILECIDSGLDSIGETGKKTVYWYLSKRRKMKTEDIPDHPSSLTEALKTLFGQGAGILERTIMRELKQAFKITLGEDLEEVVSLVKQVGPSLTAEPTSIRLH